MPSYQDFERDYHAPDREDVLNRMRAGPGQPQQQTPDTPQWQAPGAPQNTGFTGQMGQSPGFVGPQSTPQKMPQAPAFDLNQFRQGWLSSGGRTTQDLANYVNQGGFGQHGITLGGSKGDKVFQNGRFLADAVLAAGEGGRGAQWLEESGGGGGVGGMAGGAGGGLGGGNLFTDQVRQLLMSQLQGMSQPVSANDPAIAGELQSQERGAERDRQARRAASAERAAAQGLLQGGASSGAFDAEINAGFEDKANRMSDVRSQLFSREIQARRAQLAQLMNMALQSGDAEAARAIQLQLGQMDQQFRFANLGEQSRQFNDQFGRQLGRDREDDTRWRSEFGF
jgi:hypothetical protein